MRSTAVGWCGMGRFYVQFSSRGVDLWTSTVGVCNPEQTPTCESHFFFTYMQVRGLTLVRSCVDSLSGRTRPWTSTGPHLAESGWDVL